MPPPPPLRVPPLAPSRLAPPPLAPSRLAPPPPLKLSRVTPPEFSLTEPEKGPFKASCYTLEGAQTIDDFFPYQEEIASGAFGVVEKRTVEEAGKRLLAMSLPDIKEFPTYVAVKKIFPNVEARVPREVAIKEMVTEVALLRNITKQTGLDFIPTYYGCLVGNNVYVVMEWVDGYDLIDFLNEITEKLENEPERLQQVRLKLFKEVVRFGIHALPELHRAGIAHGDLRLENIRLSKTGKLYLLDLGSACFRSASGGVGDAPTEPVCPRGADRSQRQAYGDPALFLKTEANAATFEDWAQADWWALGLVLFFVLTGVHPYEWLDEDMKLRTRSSSLDSVTGNQATFLRDNMVAIEDAVSHASREDKPLAARDFVFNKMLTPIFEEEGVLELERLIMMATLAERQTTVWTEHVKNQLKGLT